MNKAEIENAIAALRGATFPPEESDDGKQYPESRGEKRAKASFDASMVLVRDALVCLNVLAGRLK